MEKNVERAGNLVRKNNGAYCKFLSANDSGENGSHQAGILISNKAMDLFITEDEKNSLPIVKKPITEVRVLPLSGFMSGPFPILKPLYLKQVEGLFFYRIHDIPGKGDL